MRTEKSLNPEDRFRDMIGNGVDVCKGVWCPICQAWIVRAEEQLDQFVIEDEVAKHYELFHTAEEIDNFIGGKNDG